MLKDLKGTSTYLADQIRTAILHGDLPPGTPLHQEQLAEQYGVSRSPIREALRQLEAEHYIDYRPNRGAVVATLSEADFEEIVEIRTVLEATLIRAAIPLLGPQHFRVARHLIDEMRRETERKRLSELNWAFHETLYGASGKNRMIALVHDHQLRVHWEQGADTLAQTVKRLLPTFTALVDACEQRNVRAAVRLVEKNLEEIAAHAAAADRPTDRPRDVRRRRTASKTS